MKNLFKVIVASFLMVGLTLSSAQAVEEVLITIKDHKFEPAEVRVPAGEKIRLRVKNLDPTAEEFESHDLKREKIVRGNGQIVVFVGPLKPGKYNFFGEFNMDTAQGYLIAE